MKILDKLFGKKEIKSALDLHGLTQTQQFIKLDMNSGEGVEVFKKLWVVYKATMIVGENVSSLPVELVDNNGDKVEPERITDKAVRKFLFEPNPIDSHTEIITQYTNFLITSGDGYIYRTPVTANPDYWVLASQNVKATEIKTDDGMIDIVYIYTDSKGVPHPYPSEDIIHIRDFNPTDRINGMSRISAGVGEVTFAELTSDYKNSLYANQAKPSGVFSTDGSLTDSQRVRLKKDLRMEQQGTGNAGNILLLEAGLDWMQQAFSPTDLNLIQSESMTESKLSSLIGVPPELLNLTDQKNFANYREARKAFYEETVIPIGNKINAALNKFFFPDGGMYFVVNKTEIDALRLEADEVDKMWWISPNTRRALQGFNKLEDEAMDKIYIPSNYIDIELASGGGDNNNL